MEPESSLPPFEVGGRIDDRERLLATWRWWEVLGMTLLGFFLGSLVSIPIFILFGDTTRGGASGASELLQGIVMDIVLMATLVLWLRVRHPTWRQIIGFPARRALPKEAAIGAGLGLLVRFAAGVVSVVVVAFLTSATSETVSLPDQVSSDLAPAAFMLFAVYAVIVAPITEEFVFRGLLYRSIRDRRGVALGAILSAIPFGLVHYVAGVPWPGVVALQITMVVTGVGLALIYERRKNLVADIAGHAAFNLLAVVAIGVGAGMLPVPWH
jgi:membrane protease YdiL (CAAX protease family)